MSECVAATALENVLGGKMSYTIEPLYRPLVDEVPLAGQADTDRYGFRLVELLPRKLGNQLKCRLIGSTIGQEKGHYEALSYVWGDENYVQEILLNEQPFKIKKNLATALQSLRQHQNSRLLWIDALSINQHDNEERSQQVARMADIYSCASRTVVYLGRETKSTQFAVDFIQRLSLVSQDLVSLKQVLQKTEALVIFWSALSEVIENPYWSRMWIVQEIAVAANLLLQIGSHQIPMESFTKVISIFIKFYVQNLHSNNHIPVSHLNLNAVWAVLEARRRYNSHSRLELDELLILFLSSKATDPRDKIYGLYSMCTRSGSGSGNMPKPDYDLPVTEVFVSALRTIIERTRSLDIMSALNPPFASPFLPSWCPNWAGPSPASLPSMDQSWCCAPGREAEVAFLNDKILQAKGHIVDEVDCVFRTDRLCDNVDMWTEEITIAMQTSRWSPYGEERSRRIAILDTLLLDAPANILHKVRSTLQAGLESGGSEQEKLSSDVYSTWFIRRLLEEGTKPWLIDQGGGVTRSVAKHRAFAISKHGYFCLLPETAMVGDELVVLYGGKVPFCVRRAECGHEKIMRRFIGDCYVHGIMRGELLRRNHTQVDETCLEFI